jgi:hypothetical protein
MKYIKLFENYDFDDLKALNLSNQEIKDLIQSRFLNDEFLSVYGATNYPELDINKTIIDRVKNEKIPYLQYGIGLESLFEFEKSTKGIEQLKKHLLGKKTLSPKTREDDKSKNRIFSSLTFDILLTIHQDKIFCRIGGDFSIYVGDFRLLNYDVEKTKFIKFKQDFENLFIDVINNLNIYTIHEIQELNK